MKNHSLTKTPLILFALLLALTGYWLFSNTSKKEEPEDLNCKDCNVIFIAYDALQAAHVSHLGYPKQTTPIMDSLAAKGISFKNAISPAPWTVPAYMSIFTGMYPTQHKLVNKYTEYTPEKQTISNINNLSPEVETLAQVMKNNGYATGGFTGDAGVHSMFGYNKGFDAYTDEKSFGSVENSSNHALEWINQNKDNKFFVFLHGYDSHGQFDTGANYQGKFLPQDYTGQFKGTPQEQRALREDGLAKGELAVTPEDINFWRGVYDSKIYDADARVGKFLEEFSKIQTKQKTIFVIFADHGTEVFEHKRIDHGFSLYNELIHVPLVFVIPGINSKQIANQVSTLDITPTIVQILGLNIDEQFKKQLKGTNLTPFFAGGEVENRDIFIETDYRNYTHKRGVKTSDGWKLVLTMENKNKELYDLNKDPQELNNLVNDNPEKAASLEAKVLNHLQQLGTNIDGPWTIGCLPVYGDQCQEVLKESSDKLRPTNQIQQYF